MTLWDKEKIGRWANQSEALKVRKESPKAYSQILKEMGKTETREKVARNTDGKKGN